MGEELSRRFDPPNSGRPLDLILVLSRGIWNGGQCQALLPHAVPLSSGFSDHASINSGSPLHATYSNSLGFLLLEKYHISSQKHQELDGFPYPTHSREASSLLRSTYKSSYKSTAFGTGIG
jgi:hypothetical protein